MSGSDSMAWKGRGVASLTKHGPAKRKKFQAGSWLTNLRKPEAPSAVHLSQCSATAEASCKGRNLASVRNIEVRAKQALGFCILGCEIKGVHDMPLQSRILCPV